MDKPRRLARRQEKDGAGSYGARLTPMSGAGANAKGDAESATEHIEFKHTERISYSLKLKELMTTARDAILAHKRMVFEIEFTRPDGFDAVRFVVLNKDEYVAMKERLEQLWSKIEADC